MNNNQRNAAYGSWRSPITAELVAEQSIRFGDLLVDGDSLYWIESRPEEKGRSVIIKHTPDDKTRDVIKAPFSARSRVHEYGGGAFAVNKDLVYFVNFDDQRIYVQNQGSDPHPITSDEGNRYADLVIDRIRKRIVCVQEAHRGDKKEPENSIVSIDVEGKASPQILVSGDDFYASPRISPDGRQLVWLAWNHPEMPWDGTELWVAEIDKTGSLLDPHKIAGGVAESIFQPEWSPDNLLYFVSDRNGWWNIYQYAENRVKPLIEFEAEFAMPQWVFGLSTYGFIDQDRLACAFNKKGIWQLAMIDVKMQKMQQIETAYNDITHLRTLNEWIIFYGGSPVENLSVIKYNASTAETQLIRRSDESSVAQGYIAKPELIEYDTAGGVQAYGFFYRPQNMDYARPRNEQPPLIIITHGGPTSCSYASLEWKIQYWTSRGFAVFDVNYGGSTGFGRPYRERLKGKWGVVDVDDCVNAARHLIKNNLVDSERLVIRGGSAGGYTTLAALTFRDMFKAGGSYYGVGDLESLARETHKFESRYLDSLIGPYPETKRIYWERSPINHVELLSAPVIFFQGLDDRVVPPNQAEKMVGALRERKMPVAYIAFEGEQHGFRKAENLKRCLEAELYFYSRIFGFSVSNKISTVHIDNL